MADQRISASWGIDPKTGEIHRKEMFGTEQLRDEVVARYDAEKQVVYFKSQTLLMKFKSGVVTYLASDEKLIKSFQREDMKADEPLTSKNIPPRPKKDPMQGDKTPAVVDWYFRYRFNEFCARYGVMLDAKKKPIKYTGKVAFRSPVWRERPGGDKVMEFVGEVAEEKFVTDQIIAQAKTHLTFMPSECVDWDEETPDTYEAPDEGDETVSVRDGGKAGDK